MVIKIDFGLHESSVQMRTRRAKVLANNIANADTPGFKARDIDFSQLMKKSLSSSLRTTHENHVHSTQPGSTNGILSYRNPMQPSIDGNTVDTAVEKAQYAENTLRFNASVNFLNGKIMALRKAFRGE